MANIHLAILGLIIAHANFVISDHSNRKTAVGFRSYEEVVNNSWSQINLGNGQRLFTHMWIGTDLNSHQCDLDPENVLDIRKESRFDKLSHVGYSETYKLHKIIMKNHLSILRQKCMESSDSDFCNEILNGLSKYGLSSNKAKKIPYSVELKKTLYFGPENEKSYAKDKKKDKKLSKAEIFKLLKNIKNKKNRKDKLITAEDSADDDLETRKETRIKLKHDKVSKNIVVDKKTKLSDREKLISSVKGNKVKKGVKKNGPKKVNTTEKNKISKLDNKIGHIKDRYLFEKKNRNSKKNNLNNEKEAYQKLVKKYMSKLDKDDKKVEISFKPAEKPGKPKSNLFPIDHLKTRKIEKVLKDIKKSNNQTQIVIVHIKKNKNNSKKNITLAGNLPISEKPAVIILHHPKNWKENPKISLKQMRKNESLADSFDNADQFELTIRYNVSIKNSTNKEMKVIKLLINKKGDLIKGTDGIKNKPKSKINNITKRKLSPTKALGCMLRKLDHLGVKSKKIEVIRKDVTRKENHKVLKKLGLEKANSKYKVNYLNGRVKRVRRPNSFKNKLLRSLPESSSLVKENDSDGEDDQITRESKILKVQTEKSEISNSKNTKTQTKSLKNSKHVEMTSKSKKSILLNKNRKVKYFGKRAYVKKQYMPYKLNEPERKSRYSSDVKALATKRKMIINTRKTDDNKHDLKNCTYSKKYFSLLKKYNSLQEKFEN